MKPELILETCLYAADLEAVEVFYRDVLGLEPVTKAAGRHVFYRLGDQMLLVFNPSTTQQAQSLDAKIPMLPHGAIGPGHICFRASAAEIETWRARLVAKGVAIEADFIWPGGGRSIYFRDSANNCLEFAESRIWGIA